ncbi:MAG: GNAT family N-acetyltransferase [Leptolyngbya sp. SIO1D8]|nr:GNAT family N-acetyltransferase [Leptolyngbya sp. SIO1D8]
MHIQQATHLDIDLLVKLGRQTFSDAFAADNDPADMEQYLATAFSPERIQAELSVSETVFWLVYETANTNVQPIGYAHLRGNASEPSVIQKPAIELSRLYVGKNAIGKGYGSKLMQTCIEYAIWKGFAVIWLGVWEKNYRAQSFYERWGFQRAGTHEFLLGKDKQTDLILVRPVIPA